MSYGGRREWCLGSGRQGVGRELVLMKSIRHLLVLIGYSHGMGGLAVNV